MNLKWLMLPFLCFIIGQSSEEADHEVKIGAIFSFGTSNGKVARIAMEAAVRDVNSNPSLLSGRKLALTLHDSNYSGFLGIIGDAPLAIIDGPSIFPPQQYSTRPEQTHHRHQRFNKNNIVIIQSQCAEIEMGGGEVEVVDQNNFKRNYNNASSSVRMKLNPNKKERILAFAKDVMRWRWTKDNDQVLPFCDEIGITPRFLRTWINNRKNYTL